jgi:two-component system sensor histidine kinase AlgZ
MKIEMDTYRLPRELPMPPLLLQPLIENAVYHGIQRMPDGGTLYVRGTHNAGMVEISVRNPLPDDVAQPRNSHALANVRARIEYHFGARGALEIMPARGEFTVIVRLPDGT